VKRDAAGRAQVVSPSAAGDIAIKSYVDAQAASAVLFPNNGQISTATYTLALSDNHTLKWTNGAGANYTITIPTNASVAFPIGSRIQIIQWDAFPVTVTGAGGVSVSGVDNNISGAFTTRSQNSLITVQKTNTDIWIVTGDVNNAAVQKVLVLATGAAIPAGTPANTLIVRY
jgi:flavoprotein